ncbi:MAG: hypothetical protein B7Z32_11105 [Hydrogenophilales bacterium 12-64-13]|nr:MAG: hypothetical protein B7Z32_11105 [Hydrogenophilales bacterium 12-64-13]
MNFYLAGQSNFGNRGCEALVRSITGMVRARQPDATILCPLDDIETDSCQWPNAAADGVSFVPGPRFPGWIKWWFRGMRVLPLEGAGFPLFRMDPETERNMRASSAIIMTGGDILTLDYGLLSLYQHSRMVENAMDHGVPAVLWAASVGPFSAKPAVERVMARHLRRYHDITVRETVSLDYLRKIGVENVRLVADPAFNLDGQAFNTDALTFGQSPRLLGINVSPLIRRFRNGTESAVYMDREIVDFIRGVVRETDLMILLIPHVDPLDQSVVNSDSHYMAGLYGKLGNYKDRISLAPSTLNAAQLKYLIGQCRYFIGARTHSTIAALSQGVPTISIAYSIKAKGINHDLFGDTRYVLETPLVSSATLAQSLSLLQQDEANIRALLADRLPEWRDRARLTVDGLFEVART